jgi:hypothetical protein
MKDLIKQKHFYRIFVDKQLLKIIREIFIYILIIFILVFYYYYICIHTYSFTNNNDELVTICTISIDELKPVNKNQSSIWYKHILDNFFNKFTSNSKSIHHKFVQVKWEVKTLMPLEPEHNISTVEKSPILNKIQSDSIKSLILECEYYKNKTSSLEIQILKTKIAYHNLIKDIDDITKEINDL